MTADIPALASLTLMPYLDATGQVPTDCQGKVGIYGIFDEAQTLQFVGYSRDVYMSLKQHLVRQPAACYGYKVETIDRPSRTLLEAIRTAWIDENGGQPPGNENEAAWTAAIDAKVTMTADEQAEYARLEEVNQIKYLKKIARRVEAEILATLKARGVQMDLRFNPKLKESGLLDLK
ncbi:MAG: GIY-YIG nuclease family protein [Cyanobacteria bacterium]|nr:GIY-YIG nuclease family protein [Cyanobacteriota bacterium]MDA0866687.1 GIY-YIG nuclease family protein [Cyanobacteriota bacterium]